MASLRIRKLKAGDSTPKFSAVDMNGNKISLETINARYILLVFLRYSGCPWCNLAIHRLTLEYPVFKEHDCEVIAFIQSEPAHVTENIYERHEIKPMFSIIADHEGRFYKSFGVTSSLTKAVRSITKIPEWVHSVKKHGFKQKSIDGNLFLVPASFMIDGRTKKIISTGYAKNFYDTETFVDLYQNVFFNEL